jgi:DNA helicase II / ATP-dependent DNA helicase PcrA
MCAEPQSSPGRPTGREALNRPQAEAVAHVDGPLIVFAGAGSGKTRVITYRIANLVAVHRVPPYRLLAVTFTNKAANEMRERLVRLLGESVTRDLWVGTFHAVCVRLLRRFHADAGLGKDFVIYDTSDQRAVVTRVMRDLSLDDKRNPPQKVLGRICREKQEARGPSDMVPGSYVDEIVQRCFVEYEKRLRESNAVDFEDLLLGVLRLAEQAASPAGQDLRSRFSHVLVDEFQDVNHVQYRLVRAFGGATRNICVVGDDDQSIYQWRGADVRNIRGFTHDFADAKLIKLEQNYRSSGHIVQAALSVIQPSLERTPKELWTDNLDGEPVTVVHASNERDEAAWVVARLGQLLASGTSPREVAIFYRVHAQSRVLEEAMRHAGVPYQIIGGTKFFERAEVKDLLSYLRVLVNPRSEIDLLRIINTPPRKIGQKTVSELGEVAKAEGCSLLAAIVPLCQSDRINAGTKQRLDEFAALMADLAAQAETASPHELAEQVLQRTGYASTLQADDSAESDARLDNLRELLGSIAEYEEERAEAGETPSLSDYLSGVSLQADADTLKEVPRVPMMTVHAAKGLEFHAVFLTGLEERLFPLRGAESFDESAELEEERRLAYVAVTRARRALFVSHAETRTIYGQTRYNEPSRFLADLPEAHTRTLLTDNVRTTARAGGWTNAAARPWAQSGGARPWGAPTDRPPWGASRTTRDDDEDLAAADEGRAWDTGADSRPSATGLDLLPEPATVAHDAPPEPGAERPAPRDVTQTPPEPGQPAADEPWRELIERARRAAEARAAAAGPSPERPSPVGRPDRGGPAPRPDRPAGRREAPIRRREEPRREPGERYVERDPEAAAATLDGGMVVRIGARVRHAKFGIGVVEDVDGGADPTVTVQFPGWPKKRIKLGYLMPA